MDSVRFDKKQEKMRDNIDTSLERECRQIQSDEVRELKSGERDELRQKWEKGATRITNSGKLAEVWNPKASIGKERDRPESGYFSGVQFDKNGKIIR